ncbi:MAG: TRAP transporter large permease [Chloroflexota bacterium]
MINLVVGIVVMGFLLASGLWISFAIGIGGLASLWQRGLPILYTIGLESWWTTTNFILVAVPLFVFMGEILFNTGLLDRSYTTLRVLLAGLKGDLVQTTIAACTLFAAMCGSSTASAATMGRISYPELVEKRHYDRKLVLGAVAAGSTLGILIPPSIILIIYGAMAEQSVGRLFAAGFIPGFILAGFFVVYIYLRVWRNPKLVAATTEKVTIRDRLVGILNLIPFLALILLVLGSIYAGWATPTESAALGCAGALVMAAAYRRLTWRALRESTRNTVILTAMIVLLIIAAKVMARALTAYQVPVLIRSWGEAIQSPAMLYLITIAFYIVVGCIFDGLAAMVVTLPFMLPFITQGGFDPIWFGIVMVILAEMAMLTPPIGINLFVLQGVTGASFSEVTKGSLPFLFGHVMLLVLLYFFPQIALWLPGLLFQ